MAQSAPVDDMPIEDRVRSLLLSSPAASNQEPKPHRSSQRGRRNLYVPFPREEPQTFHQTFQAQTSRTSDSRSGVVAHSQNWRASNSSRGGGIAHHQHGQSQNAQSQAVFNQNQTQGYRPQRQFNQYNIAPGGALNPSNTSHGGPVDSRQRSRPSQYTPLNRSQQMPGNDIVNQCAFLEHIVTHELPDTMMSPSEFAGKDSFRLRLEGICKQSVRTMFPELADIQLAAFGSLSSGFGMPGSDMDLVLVSQSPLSRELPRVIEKALLDQNYGARLLTRTRIPIIKVCEQPLPELRAALFEEREKWDAMTIEEREQYDSPQHKDDQAGDEKKEIANSTNSNGLANDSGKDKSTSKHADSDKEELSAKTNGHSTPASESTKKDTDPKNNEPAEVPPENTTQAPQQRQRQHRQRPWYREKKLGPLDFPKIGVGIQCDINFSNPLGLHNTRLLRCYSLCDPRVRPMVLFVKSWASRRKINSSYSGTLSSYGYVLMVLHFLVNVASPPVCPNLQGVRRPQNLNAQSWASDPNLHCDGWDVYFWRNEAEIQNLAAKNMLTQNRESLGSLLRQFFLYYAQQGHHSPLGGFAWTQEVLSLRTPHGVLSKEQKGWTGAKTTMHDNKEVRHRYLFAIEDPFELDHNVARTVNHNGIVAIRDEFRRAWRIIMRSTGRGQNQQHQQMMNADGDLMDVLVVVMPDPDADGNTDDGGKEKEKEKQEQKQGGRSHDG